MDTPPKVSPDLAGKVIAAEIRNAIKDVGEGGKLPSPLRKEMQMASLTPELAAQQRAAALLAKYVAGTDLTQAQWEEIRSAHPGFADEPPPRSTIAAAIDAAPAASPPPSMPDTARGPVMLTKADEARYAALYGKGWRQLRRWVKQGEANQDPCPLHDPSAMPGWWSRNMTWRCPAEIEAAAIAAAQSAASPDPPQGASPPPPMQASSATAGDAQSAPPPPPPPRANGPTPPPVNARFDLESLDPVEGDALRKLKQIQAAKLQQITQYYLDGLDASALETKLSKLSETIDKMQTRATERLKKQGLLIMRAVVESDLAANAELLRQLDASQERRVLELCASLTSGQKEEVATAIRQTNRSKERILARLDCLTQNDLLRDLAAA